MEIEQTQSMKGDPMTPKCEEKQFGGWNMNINKSLTLKGSDDQIQECSSQPSIT